MDDLEFRRRAYAEPDCQDEDFIAHRNLTPENTRFVEELQRADKTLKQAMQITPSHDLAERIKLAQALGQHQSVRKRWQFSAIASSLFLLLGLVFILMPPASMTLQQEVFAHIYDELNHLGEQGNRSLGQANALLADIDVSMTRKIARINYLGSCEIARKKGIHMVLQGDLGPITVLMLPDISVDSQQIIRDGRFHGLITPEEQGSIVVVGEKGESLQQLQDKLKQTLRWI